MRSFLSPVVVAVVISGSLVTSASAGKPAWRLQQQAVRAVGRNFLQCFRQVGYKEPFAAPK